MKLKQDMLQKFIFNKRGLSLIELLVTGAMTLIISLGVATMMQNSFKEQKRVLLLDALRNQKARFETMLRDQAIWNATLNNNTHVLFTNLEAGTAAAEVAYTAAIEFVLYNANQVPSIAYDLVDAAATPTGGPYAGFTEKGTVCTTFDPDPGQGNDECPFSYMLLAGADCATGASCTNPQLKLVARLIFNPAPNGTLTAYKNMLGLATLNGNLVYNNIADTVIDSKYDAVVKRTSATINRSFRIVSGFTPPASGIDLFCAAGVAPNGGGAGTCTLAAAVHPLTTQSVSSAGAYYTTSNGAYDTYNLVTAITSTGNFRFNETGFYGCVISVPAFATGGFTASLYNVTAGTQVAASSVTAGQWVQATTVIEAKFNVTSTAAEYQVRQVCGALPGGSPSANNCTLGFSSLSNYNTYQPIVTVTCYKIDKAI